MLSIPDDEQEAINFYSKCRSQNEHEDDLVNQRLTWLMTLQGLLFTAYGFSMSAEANSLGAKALDENSTGDAKQALQLFASNLMYVRRGLVMVGILSSLAALIGVLAAFRAIKDNERALAAFHYRSKAGKNLFPMVIGGRSSNVFGMICGAVMPFLTAGGWIWVGNLQGAWWVACIVILLLALGLTLLYVFIKVLPRKLSRGSLTRPFYDEYAWAYDLIITQPVSKQCDFIEDALSRRGIVNGARILDAGCGVGSQAIELARRGYLVNGVDLSPQLIAEARRRIGADDGLPVSFRVGDILDLTDASPYDAILCRGVLNDLLDDASLRDVFRSFAGALRSQGLLILDVREWDATALRKTQEPVFEKVVETPMGSLTFRSVTRLEHQTRRLLVSERHTLRNQSLKTVSTYDFRMRCWTRKELHEYLTQAGFETIEYFGAYDREALAGASDRLVGVASKV